MCGVHWISIQLEEVLTREGTDPHLWRGEKGVRYMRMRLH